MFNFSFLTLALTLLTHHLIEGNQISCETIGNVFFGKACLMNGTARIDSIGFTITPKRDDMKNLNFVGNKNIFYLPIKLDETFPKLWWYFASDCSIKSVTKENFMNMRQLFSLNLANNQIERIDSNTFDDQTSLDFLSLSGNPIKVMSGSVFKNLKKLDHVQLNKLNCIDIEYSKFDLKVVMSDVEEKCGGPTCGQAPLLSGMIKGGTQAKRGQWPFLVALEFRARNEFFCGGNLISSRHVLTAAHCIQYKYDPTKLEPHEIILRLGAFNIKERNELGSIERNVSRIEINPGWDIYSERWDADMALLFMNDSVTFTNIIQIVCLPTGSSIDDHSTGFVAGWGRSEHNETIEHFPRQTFLNAVTDSECFRKYYLLGRGASENTFCAGGNNSGPCDGDSGGGYFVAVDSRWTLKGMVSVSTFDMTGQCDVSKYAIYTNVVKFVPWIESLIQDSS